MVASYIHVYIATIHSLLFSQGVWVAGCEHDIYCDLCVCYIRSQTFDWWEGLVHMRGVWRSITMAPGGLGAMMTGTCRMLQWFVVNWATSMHQLHLDLQGSVQAAAPSCSVNWLALGMRASSLSVIISWLVYITALTVKMWELCVKVSLPTMFDLCVYS